MNSQDQIRIMVVDDHFVVRVGLVTMINTQSDMTVVAEAASGSQAIELFQEHQPDIVLVDLRMPGMSGVEVITTIRREWPEARCVVLTMYDGDEQIYQALQAGARAYLLKSVTREEFLDAIRAVYAGQYHVPPEVAQRLVVHMPRSELTVREREVLELIVKGKGNRDVAEQLSISEHTVKNHINNILNKLGVSDRTQAVTVALQRGIVYLD
ncbi:MAG: DNA-binding response regulator, NarL/FixJ family, contains REC and HTH domains [Chloroflexi bacterium AL-W]|nr:DNA-binding response regulator, NarL/FixJ family, contains REC and HTH domains [Chloroflexi bacterium AL-W]